MLLHGHKTSTKTPNLRAQGLARAGPDASADLASLLYAAASQHTAAAAREATAAGAARPAEARACSQPAPRSPEFTASGIATARLGSLTGPGPAPPSLNEPPAAPARRTAPRALHRERRGPAPSAAIQPLPPTRSSPRLAPPLPLALANRLSASCGRTSAPPSANPCLSIERKRRAGRGDVRERGTSAALRLDEAAGRGRGESLGRRRGAWPGEAGRGRAVRGASILAHKGSASPARGGGCAARSVRTGLRRAGRRGRR